MILDTNTYDALRDGEPAVLQAARQAAGVAVPLPVVAELKAGYLKGSRTDQNMRFLTDFLASPEVSILRPDSGTADLYARFQTLCWERGRALSNNDLWIAALAWQNGDILVTYDRDFTVFQEHFGEKLRILSVNSVQ